jgi:cytochrome c peroxidase
MMNVGTEATETLGELMMFDKNISANRNLACTSCHMPYLGFGPPIPSVNLTIVAFPGSVHTRAGKRTPQRHTYSPFFPVLQYDQVQGLFFGGNFFDSRATGYLLRIPDAEQAQGPPVDTQEMGLPDTARIAFRLSQAVYRPLFEEVWGKGSFEINFPCETEQICATPGGAAVFGESTTPIPLSAADRTRANTVYDRWAQSIDAYEQSAQVSSFSSKFDAFGGQVQAHARGDGGVQALQRQGQLQFMPPGRKRNQSQVKPDRHQRGRHGEPSVHVLRLGQ